MESRLFEEGTIPYFTTPNFYAGREAAPHLEQDGHRERLWLACEYVRLAQDMGARSVVDLGAGDGGLLSLINCPEKWGYDLQPSNVACARGRGVQVHKRNVLQPGVRWADCVIMTELLEHLINPHMLVREAALHCEFLVASSPYTETADAHYEFHTWAWDRAGFEKMLTDCGWTVLRGDVRWISQVVLAERTP